MVDESPAYVNGLKRAAFRNGLALPMLSIHQDFVDPDPALRQKDVEHTKHCLELAARLGMPGRAAQLRALEHDQVLRRPDEGEGRRAAAARPHGRRGVPVVHRGDRGLPADRREGGRDAGAREPLGAHDAPREPAADLPGGPVALARDQPRHGQLPRRAVRGARAARAARRDRAGQDLLRRRRVVHARPRLPAHRGVLRKAGFAGWVSLEMEGKEDPLVAVPKSYAVLREAFGVRS